MLAMKRDWEGLCYGAWLCKWMENVTALWYLCLHVCVEVVCLHTISGIPQQSDDMLYITFYDLLLITCAPNRPIWMHRVCLFG